MARAASAGLVVDGVRKALDRRRGQIQRHVDDQSLQPAQFVVVHPDAGGDLEPAHEHGQALAANARRGVGAREGQGG